MWDSSQSDTSKRLERRAARAPKPDPRDEHIAGLRAQVNQHLASGDVKAAAKIYRQVLAEAQAVLGGRTEKPARPTAPGAVTAPLVVLTEQGQLDVASQLFADSAHGDAAAAYELLLDRYPTCGKADEVRLMLGLVYARHLDQPDRARALIEQARPSLREQSHAQLADQLLEELSA